MCGDKVILGKLFNPSRVVTSITKRELTDSKAQFGIIVMNKEFEIIVMKNWTVIYVCTLIFIYFFNCGFLCLITQGKLREVSKECAHRAGSEIAGKKSTRMRSSGRYTVNIYYDVLRKQYFKRYFNITWCFHLLFNYF